MLCAMDKDLTMRSRCRSALKGMCAVCAIMLAACAMSMGCGAEMTVEKKEPALVTPQTNTAAALSGAGIAAGSEHYKLMQTLGAPMSKPVQDSEDGKYKVR